MTTTIDMPNASNSKGTERLDASIQTSLSELESSIRDATNDPTNANKSFWVNVGKFTDGPILAIRSEKEMLDELLMTSGPKAKALKMWMHQNLIDSCFAQWKVSPRLAKGHIRAYMFAESYGERVFLEEGAQATTLDLEFVLQ